VTRVLIATDGSAAAEEAVAAGLELAKTMGASVTFVHADDRLAGELYAPFAPDEPSTEESAARDEILAAALGRAREKGVPADVRLISGNGDTGELASSIVGMAAGIDASLIVVGSRGRGAVAGAVLGSVSHNLIKYARVPVLVVPDSGRAR
jgi:nucleotide-binding universal stress UspA family protein